MLTDLYDNIEYLIVTERKRKENLPPTGLATAEDCQETEGCSKTGEGHFFVAATSIGKESKRERERQLKRICSALLSSKITHSLATL